MSLLDLAFLFVLFVIQPWHGRRAWLQLLQSVAAGESPDRVRLYTQTAAAEWVALGVVLLAWWWLERPLAWLGVHGNLGTGFVWVGVIGTLALTVLAALALRLRHASKEEKRVQREKLGDMAHFVPKNDRELRAFFGVSLTAGIVEELLYRGFLLWALSQWMPLWVAIMLSSLGFGLAHSYQGRDGMLRTGALGLLFALIYVGSGSIWLPMLFHAVFDVIMGLQVRALYEDSDGSAETPVPAEGG